MRAEGKEQLHDLTPIILLHYGACSPIDLGDIDVLLRARKAMEAFPHCHVVGALVVPLASKDLKDDTQQQQQKLARTVPFSIRLETARAVIAHAGQSSWIFVDSCMEGCLSGFSGPPTAAIGEYARSRLYHVGWAQPVTLEVEYEDSISTGSNDGVQQGVHRVPQDAMGKVPDVQIGLSIRAIRCCVIEVPKRSRCDELLHDAVQRYIASCAAHTPVSQDLMEMLRRFLGQPAVTVIQEWARGIFMGSKITKEALNQRRVGRLGARDAAGESKNLLALRKTYGK
eukprot:TRINITY_DN8564_c2_g1_i1.p1 TRINITY_DN8564_c2_g1~~TRINITY_DN8564_c2_g1_i1.p1  ORF type:complete len:284 (+),score=40.24 TRINITY_DN8564_c2_g1_i1:77-928(+)